MKKLLLSTVLLTVANPSVAQEEAQQKAMEKVLEKNAEQREELKAEIVATSIRQKGYSCNKAESGERLETAVEGARAVWLIRCDTGSYRVIYIGDRGFRVEPIE